jgi:hypothetical protein
MPLAGFEPKISVFMRAKTLNSLTPTRFPDHGWSLPSMSLTYIFNISLLNNQRIFIFDAVLSGDVMQCLFCEAYFTKLSVSGLYSVY